MKLKHQSELNRPKKFMFWVKRASVGILIIWLCLYLLIWIFSPVLFSWQLNNGLEPLNLQLSDKSSIRINPFLLKLTMSDVELTTNSSTKVVAGIRAFTADINAFALFKRDIQFEKFELSGVTTDVNRELDHLEVAGWQLNNRVVLEPEKPTSENNELLDENNQPPSIESLQAEQIRKTEEKVDNWRINAEQIDIQEIKFNINNLGHSHQIVIKKMELNAISLSDKEQKLSLNLRVLLETALIELTANFEHRDGQGQLSINLEQQGLELDKIAYLVEPILANLSGNFSSDAEAVIKFDKQQVSVDLAKFEVNFKDIALENSEYNINLADSKVVISDSTIQIKDSGQPQLNIKFSMEQSQLEIKPVSTNDQLIGFETFTLLGGEIKSSDSNLPEMDILNLQFEQLKLSHKETQDLSGDLTKNSITNQPILQFGKLVAQDINFKKQHLSLKLLRLENLIANISLDKDKQLIGLILPKSQVSENTNKQLNVAAVENGGVKHSSTSNEVTQTPTSTFNLERFDMIGSSQLTFSDQSVQPHFSQMINFEKLEIVNIDNRQAQNLSSFLVNLKMDAYSALQFNGNIQVFNDKLNLELNSSLNEFSLPAISPYVSGAMGFEMLSGQFDKEVKLSIVDNIIRGETKLNLRGMQLSSVDTEQGNTLKEQSAMPLNKALGLLMDDKGNLELIIPLSGDVSKPTFGVSNFISIITKKAIVSAARNYLLDTFVPYANVLSVVMVAGEYMLKVSFEDLVFQPTSINLEEQQQEFVTQFINLLKDKPETQVRVCAFATRADLPKENIESKDTFYLKEYQQQLLAIALRRADAFKAWVVDKGGIKSSRLLLCKPQVDGDLKGNPRIEFEI